MDHTLLVRRPEMTDVCTASSEAGTVFIRSGLRYHHIPIGEILFVEAKKNFCNIITSRSKFMVLATMADVEAILTAPWFCRIHRSYIVGMGHVRTFDRRTVRIADQELPIGGTYLQTLLRSRPVIGMPRSVSTIEEMD